MENVFRELEEINHSASVPLYYQISESLRKLIEKRKVKSGTKLPSQESLAQYFGASRPTVSKAMDLLVKKWLVYKDKKKGSFVQDRRIQLPLVQEPISFGEALKKAGVDFRTAVVELKKIKASKEIAAWLDLTAISPLVYLKRLRYIENEPFLLSRSYLSHDRFSGLLEVDFTGDSLFYTLQQKYHTSVAKIERYTKITRASADESNLLKMPVGDPLLQMEGVAFSPQDKKIEYFNVKVKGDRIVFFTTAYADKV